MPRTYRQHFPSAAVRTSVGGVLLVLTAGLVACEPTVQVPAAERPAVTDAPLVQGPDRDPSVPMAAAVFAAQDSAKAAPPNPVASPQKPLTNAEESAAMPMAGQVNNHSGPSSKAAK
ncbi:MAG: hypothetical protein IV097_03395 [Burkholderiaceae bacterium]|nr:hypothetical protein [Burkholderiaceae bacterium]